MRIVLIIALLVLLVANVAASVSILRSNTATSKRKVLQSCFVWFIPLIGAWVVITFHRLDRRNQIRQLERAELDGSEVDVALGARHDGYV